MYKVGLQPQPQLPPRRLRALSLGPQLLPLLHLSAFGQRPDALTRALGTPTGELLREVAAPGSWGRIDSNDGAQLWLCLITPAPEGGSEAGEGTVTQILRPPKRKVDKKINHRKILYPPSRGQDRVRLDKAMFPENISLSTLASSRPRDGG